MAVASTPDYASPDSYFVFVIGNCEEWPENREEQGDIAVYREYLGAGVPPDQVVFVKDDQTTKENCQAKFKELLKTTLPSTTLVFYFGGHGIPSGFKTQGDEIWQYKDVLALIESHFQGDRVLLLLDCCASGNFCQWLLDPTAITKDYVCLCSAPPYVTATDEGEEWVLNLCWIQCMRRSNEGVPLSRAMDLLVDRTALVFGDQFFCYVTMGVDANAVDWFPRHRHSSDLPPAKWKSLRQDIPSDGKVSSRWGVGDCVFYKHPGGLPSTSKSYQYIPPCWLVGVISEIQKDRRMKILVTYPATRLSWEVEECQDHLMNDLYMAQMWMVPDEFEEAQVALAKDFKYYDFSLVISSQVEFSAEGRGDLKGSISDWRDFDWEYWLEKDSWKSLSFFGPHVLVKENGAHEAALVSVETIVSSSPDCNHKFPQSLEVLNQDASKWQRRALVRSIETSGKAIVNVRTTIGRNLAAFWPEDEVWYDADPMDPDKTSLSILATHAEFTLAGEYCPLAYEDGDFALSPTHYVRGKKGCLC